MAKKPMLDTVIRCSRVNPALKVGGFSGKVLHAPGQNCWIAHKGRQIPCMDPITGKKTVCFPYLHVEQMDAYPTYRGKKFAERRKT